VLAHGGEDFLNRRSQRSRRGNAFVFPCCLCDLLFKPFSSGQNPSIKTAASISRRRWQALILSTEVMEHWRPKAAAGAGPTVRYGPSASSMRAFMLLPPGSATGDPRQRMRPSGAIKSAVGTPSMTNSLAAGDWKPLILLGPDQ
jgi:hypothetical protein